MATFDKRGAYQIRARVQRKGRKSIARTFTNINDARNWALETEAAIKRGAYIDTAAAETTTVRQILDRYNEEIRPRLKGNSDGGRVRRLIADLGDLTLSMLDVHHVAKYRDRRIGEGAAPSSIVHEIGVLNRALKCCVMDWGIALPRGIVTANVRKPSVDNGRDRRLVADEQERLLAAADASKSREIGLIIVMALETAARRGEIQGMEWKHVNLGAGTWHIPITKTGTPRTVPLTDRALETLQALPRRIDGRVWQMTDGHSISQAFARVCKRAGINGLRFHDLRHEATSRFFERGLNMMEVAAITGHKSLSMLRRYTHLRAEDLRAKLVCG